MLLTRISLVRVQPRSQEKLNSFQQNFCVRRKRRPLLQGILQLFISQNQVRAEYFWRRIFGGRSSPFAISSSVEASFIHSHWFEAKDFPLFATWLESPRPIFSDASPPWRVGFWSMSCSTKRSVMRSILALKTLIRSRKPWTRVAVVLELSFSSWSARASNPCVQSSGIA